jgi:hypothetical protein
MLTGEGMEEHYGQGVNAAALDYFRLSWDLKDLAEYLNLLRAPHTVNEDSLRWVEFVRRFPEIREDWL